MEPKELCENGRQLYEDWQDAVRERSDKEDIDTSWRLYRQHAEACRICEAKSRKDGKK